MRITMIDAPVIATEWAVFGALDLGRVACLLRSPVPVDLRNIYRPEDVTCHGIFYTGVGRGTQLNLTSRMAAQAVA